MVQQKNICAMCRKELMNSEFTLHHIVPRAKGGKDELYNLIGLCNKCHDIVEEKELNKVEIIYYYKDISPEDYIKYVMPIKNDKKDYSKYVRRVRDRKDDYIKHRDKILAYKKKHYLENKDRILRYKKKHYIESGYYEKNREEILKRVKEYRRNITGKGVVFV